ALCAGGLGRDVESPLAVIFRQHAVPAHLVARRLSLRHDQIVSPHLNPFAKRTKSAYSVPVRRSRTTLTFPGAEKGPDARRRGVDRLRRGPATSQGGPDEATKQM